MILFAANMVAGPAIWFFIGILAAIGILAMFSPQRFAKLAHRGGSWIDTNKILAVLDKRIDIDNYVLPFSRVLGFAVFASAILIAVLINK
jgi:hypothetical protein